MPVPASAPAAWSRDALVLAFALGLQLLLFAWDAATPLGFRQVWLLLHNQHPVVNDSVCEPGRLAASKVW